MGWSISLEQILRVLSSQSIEAPIPLNLTMRKTSSIRGTLEIVQNSL